MKLNNLFYIFAVLGCWVKFTFPEVGPVFDAAWLGVMWGAIMAFAAGVVITFTHAFDKTEVAKTMEELNPLRFWLIVISAMLACHVWSALALLVSFSGFLAALRYKTLGKK